MPPDPPPDPRVPAPRAGSVVTTRSLGAQWVPPGHRALHQVGAVLEDRFPDGERDDWAALLRRHTAGRILIASVTDGEDGPVAGVAVVALLPRSRSACLLYLATHRTASVPGIGLSLMHFMRRNLPEHGVSLGFVGEVERAEDAPDALEAGVRRRRLAYYRRFGCRVVPRVPGYGMPDMTTGDLLPMHLVWLSHGVDLDDVDDDQLRALVTELYDVAYERPADDPLLARVLASMPRSVTG